MYRSGDANTGAQWIISFKGYNGDVPDPVISAAGLTGGSDADPPEVSFFETRKYSSHLLYNPIDENFMFSSSSKSNVLVKVNDLLSACVGDCTV